MGICAAHLRQIQSPQNNYQVVLLRIRTYPWSAHADSMQLKKTWFSFKSRSRHIRRTMARALLTQQGTE